MRIGDVSLSMHDKAELFYIKMIDVKLIFDAKIMQYSLHSAGGKYWNFKFFFSNSNDRSYADWCVDL